MDKLKIVQRNKIRAILQQLMNELYPDEFIEGNTIKKYINRIISVIDDEYKTEEEYNETMENTFNEPYYKRGE